MTNSSQRPPWQEDDKPWYRQFWPWFLIALPGSVVIASFVTLYIANRHADDLVVDDYYKDGLAINVQLEKARKADARGIDAQLQILERTVQVRLRGDNLTPRLQLRLSHPLEADRDFSVTVERQAPGLYIARIPSEVAPNWHWTLDAGDDSWRLDGSLSTQNFLN